MKSVVSPARDGITPSFCFGIAACVVFAVAVYLRVFVGLALRDDELYMFSSGLALIDPVSIDSIVANLLKMMSDIGYSEEQVKLFEFRDRYRANYLLHSSFIALYSQLLTPGEHFADSLRTTLVYGMMTANLVVIAFVATCLVAARSTLLLVAATLLLVFFYELDVLHLFPMDYRLSSTENPFVYMFLSLMFFVTPGMQFDVFGVSARCAFTMALIGFFVLRWSGRSALAYASLLFLALIHATYSGIVLFMVVTIDVVLRPQIFTNWRVTASALGVGGLFFWREELWSVFGGLEIAIGALLGISSLAFLIRYLSAGKRGTLTTMLQRLREWDRVKSDVVLFACGAVLISLVAYVMTDPDSLDARYTWMELSSRPLALIRVPVFFGLIFIFLRAANAMDWRLMRVVPSIGVMLLSTALLVKVHQFEREAGIEETRMQQISQEEFTQLKPNEANALAYYRILQHLLIPEKKASSMTLNGYRIEAL